MPPSCIGPEVTLAPPVWGTDGATAAAFGIRVAATRDPTQWQLVRAQGRMHLHAPQDTGPLRVDLDLDSGPLARRLRQTSRDEPLPRACGLRRRETPPRIVDATAGLCRDAMVLASLGCAVTAIERVPALAYLAHTTIAASWLAPHLTVRLGDAIVWLDNVPDSERPDVVCLDPMFELHGSAQVKKDMQVCRALVGPPDDAAALLAAARRAARERVVVKRDPDAPPLAPGVSFAVPGERVRFDVYLTAPPAEPLAAPR